MTIENIKETPQTKYRIGDVADLIGMSRDSLRHYEKRGLIPSKKDDNGYRYYTDEDLPRLISILYERKMGMGLDEIAIGLHDSPLGESTIDRLQEQLIREENEVRRHQQAIARLQMSLKDYEQVIHHPGEVLLHSFPASYVIIPQTTFFEGITEWFRLAARYPGLDMMYVYDTYDWKMTGSQIRLFYKNTQLILKKEFRSFVEYPFSETETASIDSFPCLSSFAISKERLPQEKQIRALLDSARKRGLTPSSHLYCTFIGRSAQNGQTCFHMQMYLPVEPVSRNETL